MPILKSLKQHRILLDTHVFIWIMNDSPLLTKEFKKSFESIFKAQGALLSPMSIWEIGMLVDKKRIEIDMDVLDWINKALDSPGVFVCPISPRIAIQSTRLPGEVHLNPVDRLLIATAYEENAVLVTCNKKILDYGKGKFISVLNPS
ncbi:MAG: type II toxin-antitoxin system VapC family toxin [Candidatus Rhabdochlamydia sp.]